MDLISAPMTLTALARRFDDLVEVTQGVAKRRNRRNAQQLRHVAQSTTTGRMTTDEAWIWADTAAGQLTKDDGQLERLWRA